MPVIGAILGFVCGFVLGLMLLNWMLRDKSREELRTDKELLKYGALNWAIAILTAIAGWHVLPALLGSL